MCRYWIYIDYYYGIYGHKTAACKYKAVENYVQLYTSQVHTMLIYYLLFMRSHYSSIILTNITICFCTVYDLWYITNWGDQWNNYCMSKTDIAMWKIHCFRTGEFVFLGTGNITITTTMTVMYLFIKFGR